jgi:hypothetical protein
VGKQRTGDDLDLLIGAIRSFEWFWEADGTMPALDAFEEIPTGDQDAIVATFRHWSDLPHGRRISETRVNEEHDNPKILAAKAGKHRFTVFHAGDDAWIVHGYYAKRKAKLDKAGRTAVELAVKAKDDYKERVKRGVYYERT